MKTSNSIRPFVLVLLLAGSLCAQQGVNVTKIGNVAVSLYDTIFNATSATATQTSSAVRVPGFSGYGAFSVVFAGLTGSPVGCQFAFEYQQNTGTAASAAFFTQAVTPSSSYQSFTVSPSAGFNAGDNVIVVYTCGTYPTAGTMTLTYNPAGQGPIPAGTNVIGHVIADSGSVAAVTEADGANITLGAKADAKSTSTDATPITLMQVLKEISAMEQAPATRAVTGTFFQATQPVSGLQWPAALDGSGFLKTHEQGTAAISAASLPLPSGASTSAKQPALGTAGTPAADVISIQGVTSMTPVKVDGSGVTQPISAASLPLPSGAAQDSTLTGGTAKVKVTGNGGATMDAAAGASAATNSLLHGAVYNTSKPNPATGQQEPVQLDPYSNVYVNPNPYPAVQLAQAVNNKVSAGAGTTLTNAFGSATVAGNSILCIGFEGIAAIPVFTDAQANTYLPVISSGAAAPGYSVAIASNIVGGTTDTITETTSSGSASFSCYELKGAVTVGQAWDYAAPAQATSASLIFPQESAAIANDFVAVGVGMAAGTINATPALAGAPSNLTTVDQSNTAPLGTAALAVYYSAHANVSNSPTFTQALSLSASETYSAVLVAVKPVSISLVGNVQDPCQQGAGTSGNINLTASGQLITGTAGKLTYICGMNLMTATAQNIALVEGTGSTCGTGTAGMAGGATAATGWNFAANGGFVNGGGGFWVFKTATPGDNVCLLLSSTGQTSGSYRQVQQ